jgi:hypothetical protein
MKTAVLSALAIAATTSFALAAEPVKLTADQLDNISAGRSFTTTTLGNSGQLADPGQGGNGTTTTTTNGNLTNTNCNSCGTNGPGNH